MSTLTGFWILFPERSRTLTALVLSSLILGITLYLYQTQHLPPELILFGLGAFSGLWWMLLGCCGPMLVLCSSHLRLPNLSQHLLRFTLVQVLISILLPASILSLWLPELDITQLLGASILGAGLGFLFSSLPGAIWLLIWLIALFLSHVVNLSLDWLLGDKPLVWLVIGAVCFLLASLAWTLYIKYLSSPFPLWLTPIGVSDLRRALKPSLRPADRSQPIQQQSPSLLATTLGPVWLTYGRISAWNLSQVILVGVALFSLFLLANQWFSENSLNLLIGGGGPLLLLSADRYLFALVGLRGVHQHQCAELMTLPNLTPKGQWGRQMLRILCTLQIRRFLAFTLLISLLATNSRLPESWWHWWLQVSLIAPLLNLVMALLVLRGLLPWWGLAALQFALISSLFPSLMSALGAAPPDAVLIGCWILGGIALVAVIWLGSWLWKQERWPLG